MQTRPRLDASFSLVVAGVVVVVVVVVVAVVLEQLLGHRNQPFRPGGHSARRDRQILDLFSVLDP